MFSDPTLLFEAISKLPEEERAIARVLLEGLVLKHDAKRFEGRG